MEEKSSKKKENNGKDTKKESPIKDKLKSKETTEKIIDNKKVTKEKNNDKKSSKNMKIILTISLYVIVIVLVSLISFVGIYAKDTYKMANILPSYDLETDLFGMRNIVIKVDDSTETKTYDSEGNLVEDKDSDNSDSTENEDTTTVEEPVNDESVLTTENYQKVKDIIVGRMDYMNVNYYEIKCDESTGRIFIEVPENENTDYVAQYSVTKGEFKISDNDTEEVLLSNTDIKNARVQYNTSTSGTTVYLNIQFNKEGAKKLKDISTTYVSSTDSDGNDTTKKIKMSLDDTTIMTTSFGEEMTDGLIQLSIGTSSDSDTIQSYLQQASNVAVFLNTEKMPITYSIEVNRFVYSSIISETIKTLIIVATVIFALMLIYMIIRFKKIGLLGAIASIGYVSLLLIVIRYTNVSITLMGLTTIALSILLEYVYLMQIFKILILSLDKENKEKQIKKQIVRQIECIVPLAIIAITFAVNIWKPIASTGMILFWGISLLIIYNFISLKVIFIKNKSENKK